MSGRIEQVTQISWDTASMAESLQKLFGMSEDDAARSVLLAISNQDEQIGLLRLQQRMWAEEGGEETCMTVAQLVVLASWLEATREQGKSDHLAAIGRALSTAREVSAAKVRSGEPRS